MIIPIQTINDRIGFLSLNLVQINKLIVKKINKIKVALENITKNDLMVSKWNSYLPITNKNKKEEDGKV